MSTLPTLPDLPRGKVLTLGRGDWRYGGRRLRLRVEQVRHDLSRYYNNEWVWITGQALGPDDAPEGHTQALVRVAAIADAG